jgi:transaldolase
VPHGEAVLLIAALRGNYHMTELASGKLIMSIAPAYQESLLAGAIALKERIDEQVPSAVESKLRLQPEFKKAFGPDGMPEKQLISFGLTQRTLSQFIEGGWNSFSSRVLCEGCRH